MGSEMIRNMPTDYASGKAHDTYRCDGCGAHGVKLWREYQTIASLTKLLCADCAEVSQREGGGREPGWVSPYARGEGDQIGWMIPAVPTEEGTTFWGYTSVPDAGCVWWKALPPAAVGQP